MDAVKKTKEDKELEEAMRFIDELHRDPVKLKKWVQGGRGLEEKESLRKAVEDSPAPAVMTREVASLRVEHLARFHL